MKEVKIWWWKVWLWALGITLVVVILFLLLRWVGGWTRQRDRVDYPELGLHLQLVNEIRVPADFQMQPIVLSGEDPPLVIFTTGFGVGALSPEGHTLWFLPGRKILGHFGYRGETVFALLHKTTDTCLTSHIELVSTEGNILASWNTEELQDSLGEITWAGLLREVPLLLGLQVYKRSRGKWVFLRADGSLLRQVVMPSTKSPHPQQGLGWPPGDLVLLGCYNGEGGTSGSGFTDRFWTDLLMLGPTGHFIGRLSGLSLYGRAIPLRTQRGVFGVLSYGFALGEYQWTTVFRLDPADDGLPRFKKLYSTSMEFKAPEGQTDGRIWEPAAFLINAPKSSERQDTLILLDADLLPLDTLVLPRPPGFRGVRVWAYWVIPYRLALFHIRYRATFLQDPQWVQYTDPTVPEELWIWTSAHSFQSLFPHQNWGNRLTLTVDPVHRFLYVLTPSYRLKVYRLYLTRGNGKSFATLIRDGAVVAGFASANSCSDGGPILQTSSTGAGDGLASGHPVPGNG